LVFSNLTICDVNPTFIRKSKRRGGYQIYFAASLHFDEYRKWFCVLALAMWHVWLGDVVTSQVKLFEEKIPKPAFMWWLSHEASAEVEWKTIAIKHITEAAKGPSIFPMIFQDTTKLCNILSNKHRISLV
jgi:hypothetical protein